MELNQPFLLILLISGAAFSIAGIVLYFFPRKINYWYGYRTSSSMRSQDRWDFAQRHSAQALVFLGLGMIAASLIGKIIEIPQIWGILISLGLMVIGIVILIRKVETALKARFGDS